MNVKLIHRTNEAEQLIAYCARVSSDYQDNPEIDKLIKYLIKHNHWSPLEMASLCLEITTSRAISAQIIRHRSFHFQEFSARYSVVNDFERYSARRQDKKNRQNSIDDLPIETQNWFKEMQDEVIIFCEELYNKALTLNIAREQARFLLPLSSQTKLYMHGTLRDWIHYISVRSDISTQKEHGDIALECKKIFIEQFPIISKALEWA